jgi:hypothetical protein
MGGFPESVHEGHEHFLRRTTFTLWNNRKIPFSMLHDLMGES